MDESGKPLVVYHGGDRTINDFSRGSRRGYLGVAYFTDNNSALKYAIGGGIDKELSLSEYLRMQKQELPNRTPTITKAYLDIKNPADLDYLEWDDAEKIYGNKKKLSDALEDFDPNAYDNVKELWYDDPDFRNEYKYNSFDEYWENEAKDIVDFDNFELATNSHDDLSLANTSDVSKFLYSQGKLDKESLGSIGYDGIIYNDAEAGGNTYVVFSPTQIKSATGNSGVFSSTNPDIRGSIGTAGSLYESPLGAAARASVGGVAGGTAGYATGDTPEERRQRAIAGMLLGAGAGAMASKAAVKGLGRAVKGEPQTFDDVIRGLQGQSGEISAFHGSPHRFDKFGALDKVVGTGEGAQAFGHGLYFTNKKDIAKGYADRLGNIELKNVGVKGLPVYKNNAPINYSAMGGGVAEHKAAIQEMLLINENVFKDGKSSDDILKNVKNLFDEEISYAKAEMSNDPAYYANRVKILEKYKPQKVEDLLLDTKSNKALYSVTLHKGKTPDQYDYLKWDEPVSDISAKKILAQAEKDGIKLPSVGKYKVVEGKRWTSGVDKAEANMIADRFGGKVVPDDGMINGEQLYSEVSRIMGGHGSKGTKAASDFLLRAGIDGIDYPAGSLSGAADSKARNFVVFDPNAVTIESVE